MKIAMLLLNAGRGSGEVARQHVRHLVRLGHSVVLMYPGIGSGVSGAVNLEIQLPVDQVPVHEFLPSAAGNQRAVSKMNYEEAMAYLPAYTGALESAAGEADLVFGHHANLSAIAVQEVAERHQLPYVLFVHGTGIEPRHSGGFDERIWDRIDAALRGAAGILVTTEYVRDELIRPLVEIPEERFLVLPCGVDLEEFHPGNVEGIREKYNLPERFVICPGALTATKGPQNVVAATKFYSEEAETVFIGDGDLRETLEHALGDRGRFLGFVPADDKAKLINGATLLVAAPEKKEHFGIIYAEALAGGTPVVAYEGGGVGSIVTPDVGLLTKRSPSALGNAIRGLLRDGAHREELAAATRERAEALYDYQEIVGRLESWLMSILTA